MADEALMNSTPKEVIVGPFTYEIIYDRDSNWEMDWYGHTSYRSKVIRISPIVPNTQAKVTAFHEVLHAVGEAADIKYWSWHETDEQNRPRDQIDLMARSLFMFFKSNPEFMKWLME